MIRETYGAYRFFSGGDSSSGHFSPNGLGLKWIHKLLRYRTVHLVNHTSCTDTFIQSKVKSTLITVTVPLEGRLSTKLGCLGLGNCIFICYYSTINILNSIVFIFLCFLYLLFHIFILFQFKYQWIFFMCICHFYYFLYFYLIYFNLLMNIIHLCLSFLHLCFHLIFYFI